ncbi:MAG: hypothetical protein Q9166_002534 [cf. Caloplaca sp. 2 TL-2023]
MTSVKKATPTIAVPTKYFEYPILSTLPESDNDLMVLDHTLSGVRLQDYHIAKLVIASGGYMEMLRNIHNETFATDGLRYRWLALENIVLAGDAGMRTAGSNQLAEVMGSKKNGLRLKIYEKKIPDDNLNKIPSRENLM